MKHSSWLKIAKIIATEESKCISRQVGAVIVKNDKLVGHGYNGTPAGQPNCCDVWNNARNSDGTWFSEELHQQHHEWSKTNEIHAEMNAIMHCSQEDRVGATLYCTLQPCAECSKNIAGSGIKEVVFAEKYHRTKDESVDILKKAGILVRYNPLS